MLDLTKAAAYVINQIHNQDKLPKLGKTKLFKILYLSDWYSFLENEKPMFDIDWYRIKKGPALKTYQWEKLCQELENDYGITSQWELGYYAQIRFRVIDEKPAILKKDSETNSLNRAIEEIIDVTAPQAAQLTYETEPMLWLKAHEMLLGNIVQYKEFRIDDIERIKFKNLADKYALGDIDIPEFKKKMGSDWSENKIIEFLELMNIYRKSPEKQISPDKKTKLFEKLLETRNDVGQFLDTPIVEREVIASQRIEGIHVSPETFVEEF